jgi:hypothetical protein
LYVLHPQALSHPQAMFQAIQLYKADHHGDHPTSPDQLALYFQDTADAEKYLTAAKKQRAKK